MKTINIDLKTGAEFREYPDSQLHINVGEVKKNEPYAVICSLTDTSKLYLLLAVANALEHAGAMKSRLLIPYLMGARSDRIMAPGDSFDLEIIANLINSCKFEDVSLLDVHSDVALLLIKNSRSTSNKKLVQSYNTQRDAVLICPDAGAAKKVSDYLAWNQRLTETVYVAKTRALDGSLTLRVLEPEKCLNRHCVIIDDLCDGGGTFLGIANQIQPASLELIVTHGLFSKGIGVFTSSFDKITTSNSYPQKYPKEDCSLLQVIDMIKTGEYK